MPIIRHAVASIHPVVETIAAPLKGPVLDRIYYSSRHNFVYFRIPKSANSTIMLSLAQAMGGGDVDARGAAAKRSAKKSLKLALWRSSRVQQCFKFTFVRDPFARILSAYLDKIASGAPKILADLDSRGRSMTFIDFLRRLDEGYLLSNIHWAPQADIIPVAVPMLDFVGRVENLGPDLAEVLEKIFGTGDHAVVQRTVGVTSASSRLSEFYGPEERKIVQKLYARDFELFYPDAA